MRIKPILFSTEMVQSTINDRKTQTRRIDGLQSINKSPDSFGLGTVIINGYFNFYEKKNEKGKMILPKYQKGDILWVRETFCGIIQKDESVKYHYKASVSDAFIDAAKLYWKPSIHMPKKAARIFLRVINVRCERLQDISENDCIAEGIKMSRKGDVYQDLEDGKLVDKKHSEDYFYFYPSGGDFRDNSYMPKSIFSKAPWLSFYSLWVSIDGQKSWDKNPWVWVYEFEKIERPKNF